MQQNILWIEDFDDSDAGAVIDDLDGPTEEHTDRSKDIAEIFPEAYHQRVNVIETIESALQIIDEQWGKFDAVVLDVNLTKGFPVSDNDKANLRTKFSDAGVYLADFSSEQQEDFGKNAGYYIYLYLLFKGFPKNRVIMRTAYAGGQTVNENLVTKWDEKFTTAAICPPVAIQKNSNNDNFVVKLNELYEEENTYYKVRQAVLDSILHWEYEITQGGVDFLNKHTINAMISPKKALTQTQLLDTLKTVFWLLPLPFPADAQEAYLLILKLLSEPLEAVNTRNVSSLNPDVKLCLDIMKLLRNWLAHNKIETKSAKLTEKEFVVLFAIALRARFSAPAVMEEVYEYEKTLCLFLNPKYAENTVIHEPNSLHLKVYNYYKEAYLQCSVLSLDYCDILDKLGHKKNAKCTYRHLIQCIPAVKFPPEIKFLDNASSRSGIPIYFNATGKIEKRPDDFITSLLLSIEW